MGMKKKYIKSEGLGNPRTDILLHLTPIVLAHKFKSSN